MSARSYVTAKVLAEIGRERTAQILVHGWTREHDDSHTVEELAHAGASYAALLTGRHGHSPPGLWPFEDAAWNPKDKRHDLIRAAALIVAAIERLDREEATPTTEDGA